MTELPKPYYDEDGMTLYVGNALHYLSNCEPSTFDALITDPPYSSGGMMRGDRMSTARSKYATSGSATADGLDDFSGDNRDQRSFTQWCAWWMELAATAVKPRGYAAVFTDWRQIGAVIDAVQMGGWIFRGVVVWDKTGAARPVGGRFTAQCEYAVIASNGPMAIDMTPGAITPAGFISEPLVHSSKRFHLTEKPVAVMRHLMALVPEHGRVLDPFAGSCSTLLAGRDLRLSVVGVEVNHSIAKAAAERMKLAQKVMDFGDAA